MPKEISGLRIARSFLTATNVVQSREIDFQLGARQGIQIESVHGDILIDPADYTPSPTALGVLNGNQTLHFETGSLETVPDASAEDEDTIDSEIFYRQSLMIGSIDEVTAQAAFGALLAPNGPVEYRRPLFTARNITHRSITTSGSLGLLAHVIIFYVFVEFSLAELGLILARRQ